MLQARLDIQSDIDVYARAIIDLKSRLNTLTPIGRLPPELLSEILVRGVMDDDSRHTVEYYYSHIPWIRLSHVCRHFRAVALSTPRFWSYLRLAKSQVFTELLARSKAAPLHIKARVDSGTNRPDRILALEMLLPHSHRIKELYIEGPSRHVQLFCLKTVSPFDTLEKLELTAPSDSYDYMSDYAIRVPAFVPILASSAAPPRLRHLKLQRFPFRWDDLIFSSPALTTLVVAGNNSTNNRDTSPPDVGSFDALFSALAAVAPRLEVLEIEDAIPRQGLIVTNPVQLPIPLRIITLTSLKSIRLAGNAIYVAHLLNHISSPPTASLHVRIRDDVGGKELVQSVATHMSERLPFLSLHITARGLQPLIVSGWTHLDTSGDALLQVSFASAGSHDLLPQFIQNSGPLFLRVQELKIAGIFSSFVKWTNIFPRFPSVRTLAVEGHPWDDILPALTALRRLQDGRLFVAMPSLRALRFSEFRFSLPSDGLVPFDDLLDLTIFRCNCAIPIDEVRLSECKYATEEQVERLREVVVDVEWDGWEVESTTEEEEYDSDEGLHYSDSDYGHRHRRGYGGW